MRYKRDNGVRKYGTGVLNKCFGKHPEYSNADLARAVGGSRQSVAKWRSYHNGGGIDIELIPKVCDFFDISIDELFGRSSEIKLTYHEQKVLEAMRSCNKQGQTFIYDQAQLALKNFGEEDSGQDLEIRKPRSA